MKAWLNLRHAVPERWAAFSRGLERLGYSVVQGTTTRPGDRDILVSWNRIQEGDTAARAFESRGRPVLVTENAAWGNDFAGKRWYSIASRFHNTAGTFPIGSVDRWDRLGVRFDEWRAAGETVVLPQRGIGPKEVAMPRNWTAPGRVRAHPGRNPCIPLRTDLARCGKVVTWGSGAAIHALMWGIPVESHMPNWIGEQDNTDAGRLSMFRRLAWAQWQLEEIASGEPLKRMLA